MPSYRTSSYTSAKVVVALLLTLSAGVVDVTGFLICWHVFTAHMTGNTVHLAMSLVERHWGEAAKAGLAVPVFLVGSIAGRVAIEYFARARWRRAASLVFFVEAALLSEVIWLNTLGSSSGILWTCLFLLSLTMGLQTAALTRVGPLTVHTTFVTGMLNSLAQRVSNLIFWWVDHLRRRESGGSNHPWRSRAVRESALLVGVWISYVAGGVIGAVLGLRWNSAALFVPLAGLFVAIVVDQLVPLTIEEEQEEAKQELPLREEPKPHSI